MATKTELQEQALQLEVSIYHPVEEGEDRKELTKAELVDAIDLARTAQLEEHQREEAEKQAARDADKPGEEPDPEPDPEPAPSPIVSQKKRIKRGGAQDPSPARLKKTGLTVSKADRTLAKKHGYPIAIPGGKAYTSAVHINCIFGGGLRPRNTVVILTDAEADSKADYLTPVK